MITVSNYLNKLLFEHDCVVLPELGGFIAHTNAAYYSAANGTFYPPTKRVAFNEALKLDDGLLTHYIALNEQLSHDEAKQKVRSFVDFSKQSLKLNQEFLMEGLGKFVLTSENKIAFEPILDSNFLQESFGFTNLKVNEVAHNQPNLLQYENNWLPADREEIVRKPKSNSIYRRVIYVGSAMVAALLFYSSNSLNTNHTLKSSLNPFDLFSSTEETKVVEAPKAAIVKSVETTVQPKSSDWSTTPASTVVSEPIIEPKVETAKVVENAIIEPVVNTENKYVIIAGAFTRLKNANKLVKFLKENGFSNASVIVEEKRLVKVTAGEFKTEKEASKYLDDVSVLSDSEAWVLHKK